MKLKHLMLAAVLAVTSVPASAFDLGKFLEERVNKELNKDKPAQTAPAQTSPAPAQTAAAPQDRKSVV